MFDSSQNKQQEIDGETYIRPEMRDTYVKPSLAQVNNLQTPQVQQQFQFQPKKSAYQNFLTSG